MAFLPEYLDAELRRLDVLIHREILRLRARYQLSLDEFRGLYISDRQVDALIRQTGGDAFSAEELTATATQMRAANLANRPAEWAALESEFQLSLFEQDVLLLALARDIDLKYEALYAYLNNDVARKKPTVDLALRVCDSPDRNALLPDAPLFAAGLLLPHSGAAGFLANELQAPMPILRRLTGLAAESFVPPATAHAYDSVNPTALLRRLFLIESPDLHAARAAIESACNAARRRLLVIDLETAELTALAKRIRLLQRLEQCGICFLHSIELLAAESRAAEIRAFFEELASPHAPVWVLLPPNSNWRGLIPATSVRIIRIPGPDYRQSLHAWSEALPGASTATIETLAARHSLTSTQIVSAASYARDIVALSNDSGLPGLNHLSDAVRSQSESTIGRFACRLDCRHDWDDLVLPSATLRQIREITGAIEHRHTVFTDWGFKRLTNGVEGLKVLFAGGSGTGKTMTAGIVANHLGLEVFRVDLAGVVSKYIGETEKNLDRVFNAARGSQAILFFDEADALFGKRSEVKDAHDRYANIEIAYLLQKFEEHDGPVILATNLRRNIDEAFSRRLHYVVEFPAPDEAHRLLLWRKAFPPKAPVDSSVDFPFLAAQFPLTGGDIRNVALDAAFLAAQDGGVVTMRQLASAMSRQMLKQGKAPAIADFKQYHGLLS